MLCQERRKKRWDSVSHLPDHMPSGTVKLPPIREGLHASRFAGRYLSRNERVNVAFPPALI